MKSIHGSSLEDTELLHQIVLQVSEENNVKNNIISYFYFHLTGIESSRYRGQTRDPEAREEKFRPVLDPRGQHPAWIFRLQPPRRKIVRKKTQRSFKTSCLS